MIENRNTLDKGLESALKALKQAKVMLELAKQEVRSVQYARKKFNKNVIGK